MKQKSEHRKNVKQKESPKRRIVTDEKHQKPYFSFVNYSEHKYGLDDLQDIDYKCLIRTLCKLSKLDWTEIEKSPRHKCGTEKIKREELRATVPPFYDKKNIIAFRYKGKAPTICVRDGFCVDILFTDHNFSIYDHD